MPINLNLPMPEPEKESYDPWVVVADIPMGTNEYRFSGIKLLNTPDGGVVKKLYPVNQPMSWSNRALIGVPGLVLR
jgi:hypothetical protein